MSTKQARTRTDYHVHTARCGHAGGDMREYVVTALERGLDEIAFTDHVPLYFLPGDDPDPRDRDDAGGAARLRRGGPRAERGVRGPDRRPPRPRGRLRGRPRGRARGDPPRPRVGRRPRLRALGGRRLDRRPGSASATRPKEPGTSGASTTGSSRTRRRAGSSTSSRTSTSRRNSATACRPAAARRPGRGRGRRASRGSRGRSLERGPQENRRRGVPGSAAPPKPRDGRRPDRLLVRRARAGGGRVGPREDRGRRACGRRKRTFEFSEKKRKTVPSLRCRRRPSTGLQIPWKRECRRAARVTACRAGQPDSPF